VMRAGAAQGSWERKFGRGAMHVAVVTFRPCNHKANSKVSVRGCITNRRSAQRESPERAKLKPAATEAGLRRMATRAFIDKVEESMHPATEGFEDLAWIFTCDSRNRGLVRQGFDEAAVLWKAVKAT